MIEPGLWPFINTDRWIQRTALLVGAALFALPACDAGDQGSRPAIVDSPAGEEARIAPQAISPGTVISLSLIPSTATRMTVLTVSLQGAALQSSSLRWYVNDSPVFPASPDRFECSTVQKGSAIHALALAGGREVRSNTVIVRNAPPALGSVKLTRDRSGSSDSLMIEASAGDADGDAVTIQYAWTVNGAPAGANAVIGRPAKRGDAVSVTVRPYDGEALGEPVVLTQEISNTPPTFDRNAQVTFDGAIYRYRARATDPDGDVIAYTLEQPDEGMTIDRTTGELFWQVPNGFTGQKDVRITADDGHGGIVVYPVTLTIQ